MKCETGLLAVEEERERVEKATHSLPVEKLVLRGWESKFLFKPKLVQK
jgi:hypothetical protein